jgi:hypothetical protein
VRFLHEEYSSELAVTFVKDRKRSTATNSTRIPPGRRSQRKTCYLNGIKLLSFSLASCFPSYNSLLDSIVRERIILARIFARASIFYSLIPCSLRVRLCASERSLSRFLSESCITWKVYIRYTRCVDPVDLMCAGFGTVPCHHARITLTLFLFIYLLL